jgi:hypothetical protein
MKKKIQHSKFGVNNTESLQTSVENPSIPYELFGDQKVLPIIILLG